MGDHPGDLVSPRQVADDAGRQIRSPYLGPKNMRFPFDWTLSEMGLAFAVGMFALPLFLLVIPTGLVVGLSAHRAGRALSRRSSPDDPRTHYRVFVGAVAVLCLLISLNPMTWIGPLLLPFALVAGLVLPIYVVRTQGRYLDWNRPFGYWLRLPKLVARGPREREVEEMSTGPLMLGMDLAAADRRRDLDPVLVITSAPKGGKSPEKRLVPIVQAQPAIAPPVKRETPIRHQARHKLIERSPNGFYVGKTEYRIEWTF